MEKYNPKKIEKKWQSYWEKKKLFQAKDFSKKPKFYSLIEFPYPSGEGLHVGHIRSNTAMDIISRKRRMEGFDVLYPIGWDAFGLPTENYAIKTGIHPKIVTKRNTDNFRKQLKEVGFSFDWSREINTSDPAYYKWTQWIFLEFLKQGLAYKKKMAINWCPKDKIGLANEEVIDGKCERCGTPVEKREKEQWMLGITKYADRLDKDLDLVDFQDRIKIQQRNWIGKSEGSEIDFRIETGIKRELPKKILIGTRNPAKVKMVKEAFPKELGIEFLSLDDVLVDDSSLEEGDDYLENARKKSEFYFKKTGIPTISTDHIMWSEKFPDNNGLIVHARALANPNSSRATDEEVAVWIKRFVAKHGPSRTAFLYAVAFTDASGTVVMNTRSKDYLLQKKSFPKKNEGYVFDRFMLDEESGEFRVDQGFSKGFGFFGDLINRKFFSIFSEKSVKVFTTRADTLFGVTYIVLSPEHPLVRQLLNSGSVQNKEEVVRYIETAKKKTEEERIGLDKDKTGIELKGVKAINPANGGPVSVWLGDYVLADYGTGAVMAVPAHDERDYVFAKKYHLPIKQVIAPFFTADKEPDAPKPDKKNVSRRTIYGIVKHWQEDKYIGLKWKTGGNWQSLIIGGVEEGEDPIKAAEREIREETGYKNLKFVRTVGPEMHSYHFAPHKDINRYAYGQALYFELVDGDKNDLDKEEAQKHEVVFVDKAKMQDFLNLENNKFAWTEFLAGNRAYTGDGVLINSNQPKTFTYTEGKEAWQANEPEVLRPTAICVIKHWAEDKYLFLRKHTDGKLVLVAGGIEKGESLEACGKREILEETGFKNARFIRALGGPIYYRFYSTHGKQNRKSVLTPAYFELLNGEQLPISEEEKALHDLVWLSEKEIGEFLRGRPFNPIFWKRFKGEIEFESGYFDGMTSEMARKGITQFAGGRMVKTYKLRDWVFSRQRYWGEPIPVVYCEQCAKTKPKVLLIHGFGGRPDENWFPWLKAELIRRGFEVFVPQLPNTDNPKLSDWLSALKKLKFGKNDRLFVIGHSLGGPAALQFIQAGNVSIEKLVLVAPVAEDIDWQHLLKHDFTEKDLKILRAFGNAKLDWKKLVKKIKSTAIYLSSDDELIPPETAGKFEALRPTLRILENRKHFSSGMKIFPELLEEIHDRGGYVPVPEKDLPIELPDVKNYKPTDTGESPLASMPKWVNTKCPVCGGKARRETDTMPNWAGSSWYYLRYVDPKNRQAFADPKKLSFWSSSVSDLKAKSFNLKPSVSGPVDWYNGGMEHTTLHLLYSRFWHKFLFDRGLVPTPEPYSKRTSHGLILAAGGVKMSKSKGNVINPDSIVKTFGADALRLYEMFIGPFEQSVSWSEDGLVGTYRFLERVWRLQEKVKSQKKEIGNDDKNRELLSELHKTIKKISEDVEAMKFNTAVSQMMIFVNECEKHEEIPAEIYKNFLILLQVFAPHIAEELWHKMGGKHSIQLENWPKFDENLLKQELLKVAVQINGKVRTTIEVPAEATDHEAAKIAMSSAEVLKWLGDKKPKKVIYVKGRILSIVA